MNYYNIINFFINILWNISKIIINIYNYLANFVKLYYINNNKKYKKLHFIKNNNLILTKKTNYKQIELSLDYDYIVFKYRFEDKLYTTILSDINNFNENKLITICDFQFIYVSIKTDEKTIDITNILKNNKNYFYIIDSILFNEIFMSWIFNYKLNIYLDNYTICILDNNLNKLILNKNEYIKLNYNNYDIINI